MQRLSKHRIIESRLLCRVRKSSYRRESLLRRYKDMFRQSWLQALRRTKMVHKHDNKIMKSLTLVPLGGLCNRIRAILSAISLAQDCGTPLHVVWLRDSGLGACFSDLFEPLPAYLYVQSQASPIPFRCSESTSLARYGVPLRRNFFLPGIWQSLHFTTILREKELVSMVATDASQAASFRDRLHGHVLIQTGLGFYPTDDRAFTRLFIPTAPVRYLLTSRQNRITAHTVGVHIRRTDNVQSIKYSPIDAFESAMEKDLQRDSQTEFYVATDDPSVISALSARFPSRIITPPSSVTLSPWRSVFSSPLRFNSFSKARSTVQGMQEAVAELLTLIACPRFHGSYWSSFSDMVVACHEKGTADIIRVEPLQMGRG